MRGESGIPEGSNLPVTCPFFYVWSMGFKPKDHFPCNSLTGTKEGKCGREEEMEREREMGRGRPKGVTE